MKAVSVLLAILLAAAITPAPDDRLNDTEKRAIEGKVRELSDHIAALGTSVDGLEETYKRAEVDPTRSGDGTQFAVSTKNVDRITFDASGGAFTIDGQVLKGGANPSFEKTNGKWAAVARLKPSRSTGVGG